GGRPATPADIHEGDEGVGRSVGDGVRAVYETQGGIPLYFDSRKDAGERGAPFGTRLIGTRGEFSIQIDEEPLVFLLRKGRRIPVSSGGLEQPEPISGIRLLNGGHHGAVEDLLAAMREGREPLCGPQEGREILELSMGVFASFAAGGSRVELPLRVRSHPLAG
ncbi:MAG: hypothetical protein RLZZ244_755, partial [Verrucomicrobiota bacterium]